jgi:hypothetical protein
MEAKNNKNYFALINYVNALFDKLISNKKDMKNPGILKDMFRSNWE